MNRLQEIEQRKAEIDKRKTEIRSELETVEDVNKVEELEKEVDSLDQEATALTEESELISEHNENENEAAAVEEKSAVKAKKMEEKNMKEERKYNLSSPEYRTAWAKKVMGLSDDKFTEEEKRALGDAITTTATEFVASDADTQGINNGGLFIPTSVRMELMELMEKASPFFRDIRKLAVQGNVDLPYLFEADDANWYAETTETKNEGQEYKNLQLTGWELAKDVVITWKLEEMAVDSFIDFIIDELFNKMAKTLITATIYGTGSNMPTGAIYGETPVQTGDDSIARVLNTYGALSEDAKIGANVYISSAVNLDIISYKDNNGNYPYLAGLPKVSGFNVEVDPYLKEKDILAGNARYYILNENTPVRLDKERTVKGRKVTYGAYAIYDGKPKPGYFKKGTTANLPSA